jgi:hypothetical protein
MSFSELIDSEGFAGKLAEELPFASSNVCQTSKRKLLGVVGSCVVCEGAPITQTSVNNASAMVLFIADFPKKRILNSVVSLSEMYMRVGNGNTVLPTGREYCIAATSISNYPKLPLLPVWLPTSFDSDTAEILQLTWQHLAAP